MGQCKKMPPRHAEWVVTTARRDDVPTTVPHSGRESSRRAAPLYKTALSRQAEQNAVVPFFLTSIYEGERPALPMIDVTLTKENALPPRSLGADLPGLEANA